MSDVNQKNDRFIVTADTAAGQGYRGAVAPEVTSRENAPAPLEPRGARRSPDPSERLRDAERSRQRIVDAAMREFSEKGFAGARVRAIAQRAGVNPQLISYYFGGKEGLYDEIMRRWHEQEACLERHV